MNPTYLGIFILSASCISFHSKVTIRINFFDEWCTNVRVDHVGFGIVQGKDGKQFKTRSGDTVHLVYLLDQAEDRVRKILENHASNGQTYIDQSEIKEASKAIGYGAVKYADLSSNRQKDYRFYYDAMLNLTGDTAVY